MGTHYPNREGPSMEKKVGEQEGTGITFAKNLKA